CDRTEHLRRQWLRRLSVQPHGTDQQTRGDHRRPESPGVRHGTTHGPGPHRNAAFPAQDGIPAVIAQLAESLMRAPAGITELRLAHVHRMRDEGLLERMQIPVIAQVNLIRGGLDVTETRRRGEEAVVKHGPPPPPTPGTATAGHHRAAATPAGSLA